MAIKKLDNFRHSTIRRYFNLCVPTESISETDRIAVIDTAKNPNIQWPQCIIPSQLNSEAIRTALLQTRSRLVPIHDTHVDTQHIENEPLLSFLRYSKAFKQ